MSFDLSGILGAATSGGLLGLLGPLAGRAIGIWEKKENRKDAELERAQEVRRWGHEKELLNIQMTQAAEGHEQDFEMRQLDASGAGLTASLEAEKAIGAVPGWVNSVRALIRPFLTLETQIVLVTVYFFSAAKRPDLEAQIVETLVFSASTTLLWWFGERAQRKAGH